MFMFVVDSLNRYSSHPLRSRLQRPQRCPLRASDTRLPSVVLPRHEFPAADPCSALVSCNSGSRNKSLGVREGSLGEARNTRQDIGGAFRPHERFRLLVVPIQEFLNGAL
jgi:hypothetical protein